MADPPPPTNERPPSVPRWVKLSVIVVVVLVALIVVVALVVGGEHGPARHVLAGGNLAGTPLVQLRR